MEARRLLDELSSLSDVMAQMRRRLAELGYAGAGAGIGEAEEKKAEEKKAEEEKAEEEKKEPPLPPPLISPTEPDSPFQGHPIHLPFRPVDVMFKTFIFAWNQARIGSPKDDAGRPIDPVARFAPFAIARASATDPGKAVPVGAFRSADVFREWANENGFRDGMSFRIEGLMVPPGFQRRAATTWVPSAESETSRTTGLTFEPVDFTPSSVPFDPRTQKGKPGK